MVKKEIQPPESPAPEGQISDLGIIESERVRLSKLIEGLSQKISDVGNQIAQAAADKSRAKEQYNAALDLGNEVGMARALEGIRSANSAREEGIGRLQGFAGEIQAVETGHSALMRQVAAAQNEADRKIDEAKAHVDKVKARAAQCHSLLFAMKEVRDQLISIKDRVAEPETAKKKDEVRYEENV